MQKPIIQDCMSQLYQKNPKLYQELKRRQMGYIQAINDLNNQNKKLKILLEQQNNNFFYSYNTSPIQNTPYHNFIDKSTIQQNNKNQTTIYQPSSFPGKRQCFKNCPLSSSNTLFRKYSANQGSQKIIIKYSTPICSNTQPQFFFSNIINPQGAQTTVQMSKKAKQVDGNIENGNGNIENGNGNGNGVIYEENNNKIQRKQNIWQARTNKSIHKEESIFFQSKKNNQKDQGQSQIVDRQNSRSSTEIIENALVYKNPHRLADKTLQHSSSIYLTPSLQSIGQSAQKSNLMMAEKNNEQIFKNRNRPTISNKVYL